MIGSRFKSAVAFFGMNVSDDKYDNFVGKNQFAVSQVAVRFSETKQKELKSRIL